MEIVFHARLNGFGAIAAAKAIPINYPAAELRGMLLARGAEQGRLATVY